LASITVTTGAIVEGRLLARTAAVTLDSNVIGVAIPAGTTPLSLSGRGPVALGSASTFAVLAASTVTSIAPTTINGDLGLSPGTSVTGSPTVNGTIHIADGAAAQAQGDLTTAYNDAAGRTPTRVFTPIFDLGGLTLTSGVYNDPSSFAITGTLTLDAQGDPNAVWIFQAGSTLVTASGSHVLLINGAQAANVFWQVGSSATLGTGSVFKGTIMALASITVTTGVSVEGRMLARTAAVTLDSPNITLPSSADTGTTAPTVSSTVTANGATGVATALGLQSAAKLESTAMLESAALPAGPYTDAAGQSLNLEAKTITVPLSGNRFYRIRSNQALTITSITIADSDVVIEYR